MLVHKTGTTFLATISRRSEEDLPLDLSEYTILSHIVNTMTSERYPLQTATNPSRPGVIEIFAPYTSTREWPPGVYNWDVLMIKDNNHLSVPADHNLIIQVIPGVTTLDD